jgi:hypothetical protein
MKPVEKFLLVALVGAALSACTATHMHRISREQARVVLTEFVNQQFERKTLAEAHLPREGRLAWPRPSEQSWRFQEFARGRWAVATELRPPEAEYTGFYVRASVDEFGKSPQLEAAKYYLP